MKMKYKTLKRVTKSYLEIFSREKETKEICIDFGDSRIIITEHQFGDPIDVPHLFITVPDTGAVWSMDLNTFFKRLTGVYK